jgi:hypothetical protein
MFLSADQQIEPAVHFAKKSAVLDVFPANVLVVDGLDHVSVKIALSWTGMFSSSRILNPPQP